MSDRLLALALFMFACLLIIAPLSYSADWAGVDETVVEKFAAQAGRHASEPFINTDQGDLLLFVFLIAGATGGFMAGYFFRALFHEPRKAG